MRRDDLWICSEIKKKHYLRVLDARPRRRDDACARYQGEIDARRRCASTYATEKGRRERRRREGAAREYSGRQGFVSLSVGNQVSGPVGRPLSISVLLAVYNTLRASLSRALTPSSSLFSSIHPLLLAPGPLQCYLSLSQLITTATGIVTRVGQREGNSNDERMRERERKGGPQSYRNSGGTEAVLPTRANRITLIHART